MRTIYTAIFGPHDTLKEPTVVTPGWQYLCFTDQKLESDVWRIIDKPVLQGDPIRTARRCKIRFWEYVDTDFSMWLDASFHIRANLDPWYNALLGPMTCVQHPFRDCVYEEAKACLRNRRGNAGQIERQVEAYRALGVPAKQGVIASGLLLRRRTREVVDFCDLWWESVAKLSTRDQLGFAYAAHHLPIFNLLRWDYRTAQDLVYQGHIKRRK